MIPDIAPTNIVPFYLNYHCISSDTRLGLRWLKVSIYPPKMAAVLVVFVCVCVCVCFHLNVLKTKRSRDLNMHEPQKRKLKWYYNFLLFIQYQRST